MLNAALLGKAVNFLFPHRCPGCRDAATAPPWRIFCPACLELVELLRPPLCSRCGEPFAAAAGVNHPCGTCLKKPPPFARAVSAAGYAGPLAAALQQVKYNGDPTCVPALAALAGFAYAAAGGCPEALTALAPVPLHKTRLAQRGYNQSALLARELARWWQRPLWLDAVDRSRPTPAQVSLPRDARQRNVAGAFQVTGRRDLQRARLLLIDDVMTTGATVAELSRVLLAAGAGAVEVLTVARAL